MINTRIYKPHSNVTKDILKDNNFKYIDGYYSYRFPVYKSNKTIVLWGLISLDIENKTCYINVIDNSNNTYAAYHNRVYGRNEVVNKIDLLIKEKMNQFVKMKIVKVVK